MGGAMGLNKVGPVLIGNQYNGPLGKPKVVVLYDPPLSYKQWVRQQVGSDCLIVVRWVDVPSLGEGAWVWFMRYEQRMREMAQNDPNVAFCGLNEVADNYADLYCVYELDRLNYMHRAQLRSVVGNWSVGCPDLPKWEIYKTVLKTMRPGDLAGLHEYWSDTYDITNRWHCGRWTMVPELWNAPIVVTECGRDIVEGKGAPGWQRTCNEERFMADLDLYSSLLDQFPNVVGAAVFQAGAIDPQWQPFDVAAIWPKVVEMYEEVSVPGQPKDAPMQGIVLLPPLRNPIISQYLGEQAVDYSPMPGHPGLDYACPPGTVLRAVHDGVVWVGAAPAYSAYGTYCWLECRNDAIGPFWVVYGHCSRILAEHKEVVKAGNIIALSGNTGRSTGPHLHLGIETTIANAGYRDSHDPTYFWWNPADFMGG
jgi:hypothetical protein